MGSNGKLDAKPSMGTTERHHDLEANSGANYPLRSMPGVTGIKAPGLRPPAEDPQGIEDISTPEMGTRPQMDVPEESGVHSRHAEIPVQEVQQAKQNTSAQKSALAYIRKATRVDE